MKRDRELIGIVRDRDVLCEKIFSVMHSCTLFEQLKTAKDFYRNVINKNFTGNNQTHAFVVLDFAYKNALKRINSLSGQSDLPSGD